MKKVLLITLVVAAMIGVAPLSGKAGQPVTGRSNTKAPITYMVNVYPSSDFVVAQNSFWVVVYDGTGKNVAAPKRWDPRNTTYLFQEMGPVTGYRGATLVPDSRIKSSEYYINTTYRFDTYTGGHTYYFNLYPSFKMPD